MAITKQALVQSGIAFVYWQFIEGCDRETYSRLENEARLKSLGAPRYTPKQLKTVVY